MTAQVRDAMIAGVYARIHDRLGGENGYAPHARFGHAADYKPAGDKGVLQFIVTITDGINRGRRRTIRHNWRENCDSAVVAAALLDAYDDLKRIGI
jgi:hypothetical protein